MTATTLNTPLRLDHLAIWVSDMEQSLSFLCDVVGFQRHPMVVEVSEDDPTCGGMKAMFADGNGLWLELILPTAPGPGLEILEQVGDGAIVEVNFEAVDEDYRALIDDMTSKGIQMLGMDGSILKDYGRIDEGVAGNKESKESGQYIAYWPTELTGGTTVEVYEKLRNDATNLLNMREREWMHNVPDVNAPCIDHLSIVVENLEHASSFYTDIMGLSCTNGSGNSDEMKVAWIDANGVWIQLCQPVKPGPLMELMKEKGSGYPMKIVASVNDFETYCSDINSRGIDLITLGSDSVRFPPEVSRGMEIEVVKKVVR
ncbi:VOC family protein [Pseudomaricurvus alkylphenolicus]|uniref:VOC family protein n=1 Tax=Pseudomaricurvus alkylphenolicus TaxID=1306991 RepID=UPI001421E706|nr:VOC family protein [Pseudomaricurvus alkylphenolicus]NIB42256.1 VOC family protein [Pseudomaricurvus alkylphenolicus]